MAPSNAWFGGNGKKLNRLFKPLNAKVFEQIISRSKSIFKVLKLLLRELNRRDVGGREGGDGFVLYLGWRGGCGSQRFKVLGV